MSWFSNLFRPKPKPTPTPVPGMQLTVVARDSATKAPLIGTVTMNGTSAGINGSATYWVSRATFSAGLNVDVAAEGYTPQWRPVTELIDPTVLVPFDLVALPKPLETIGQEVGVLRIGSPDIFFADDRGDWAGVGVIAFSLIYWWFHDQTQVDRLFDLCIAEDVAFIRALLQFNRGDATLGAQGIGRFIPAEYPNFDQRLGELKQYAARRQKRLLIDDFADMGISKYRPDNPLALVNQPVFHQHMATVLAGATHVILGGGNQAPGNNWNPANLGPEPTSVMAFLGSMNEDQLPALVNGKPWKAAQFDPARGDFVRKCKAVYDLRNGFTTEGLSIPGRIWINEPIGIGPNMDGTRTTNNPRDVYEFNAGLKAFGAAATTLFMRMFGNAAASNEITAPIVMPDAVSLACLRAGVRGFHEIPRGYALGTYGRGDDNFGNKSLALAHTDAWADRTYELRNGPTSIVFALGRDNYKDAAGTRLWKAQWQDGATPVQSWGYNPADPSFFATTRG